MGRHQPLMVDDIGEQQIIHMAAVAGNIDDLVTIPGQAPHLLGPAHRDAAIKLVPQPAHHPVTQPDQAIGEIGANLVKILQRPLLDHRLGDPFGLGLGRDGGHHILAAQQLAEHLLPVRQAWSLGRLALTAEVDARYPRQLVRHLGPGAQLVDQLAQGDRAGVTHLVLPTMQRHHQRLAQAGGDLALGRILQASPSLASWCPFPEQGHRHQLDIQLAILLYQLQPLLEGIRPRVRPTSQPEWQGGALQPDIARQALTAPLQRREGAGQAQLTGGEFQSQQIAERIRAQGIDDGTLDIEP